MVKGAKGAAAEQLDHLIRLELQHRADGTEHQQHLRTGEVGRIRTGHGAQLGVLGSRRGTAAPGASLATSWVVRVGIADCVGGWPFVSLTADCNVIFYCLPLRSSFYPRRFAVRAWSDCAQLLEV